MWFNFFSLLNIRPNLIYMMKYLNRRDKVGILFIKSGPWQANHGQEIQLAYFATLMCVFCVIQRKYKE